jgi:hypothetical protein
MMKNWQDFLDSLSTKGGNIAVAFVMVCTIAAIFLHVVHHAADVAVVEVFKSILTGFVGALLAMLSGNASRQQMQDRIETVLPELVPPKPAPAPTPAPPADAATVNLNLKP